MTGPGDDPAASGRMRASRADRERVIDTLKAAFVEERLTKDELDVRAGQAYTSRTYAELAAVTADLPAGPAGPPPAGRPRPERPPAGRNRKRAILMGTALTLQPSLLVLAVIIGNDTFGQIVMTSMMAYFVFATVAVMGLIGSRLERSRGQLPPPAAPPGQLPA